MKRILTAIVLCSLLATFALPAAADLVANQSFESSLSDDWGFVASPATYNNETTGDPLEVNGSQDVWAAIIEFTGDIDTASQGTKFWGMQDLNNSNGGGAFDHILAFDAVDLSSFVSAVIAFDYNVMGYDNGDDLDYEVFFDNVSQGVEPLVDGGSNFTTSGWETKEIVVPDTVNSVSLRLIASQNGDDFGGWDNVQLNATVSAVPEPTAFLFGSLIAGVMGLTVARRRA